RSFRSAHSFLHGSSKKFSAFSLPATLIALQGIGLRAHALLSASSACPACQTNNAERREAMKSKTRLLLVSTFALIISFCLFTSVAEQARNQNVIQMNRAELLIRNQSVSNPDRSQTVKVDGVTIRITGPSLPDSATFTSSEPGDAIQSATA